MTCNAFAPARIFTIVTILHASIMILAPTPQAQQSDAARASATRSLAGRQLVAAPATLNSKTVTASGFRKQKPNSGSTLPRTVSFLAPASYSTGGSGASSVAVADLTGDGTLDVVVTNQFDGTVGVLLGNGDGTLRNVVVYSVGGGASSITIADVNGDHKPDLIVVGDEEAITVAVLLANGDGTFQPAVTYSSGGYGYAEPSQILVADVNLDGKPDLVLTNQCADSACMNGSVSVLLGNGNGTFQPAVSYSSGGYLASGLALADFNGDGIPDLAVTNCGSIGATNCAPETGTTGNGTIGVLLGKGDGTFQAAVDYSSGAQEFFFTRIAVADVNGDGKPDLLVANEGGDNGNGEGSAGVLLGNGDGTFQPVVTYDSGGDWANSILVADLNEDGVADLVLTDFSGTIGVLLGKGDGTFQAVTSYGAGGVNHSNSALVADLNGDNIPDVVVLTWEPLEVLLGNGDGTLQQEESFNPGDGGFVGVGPAFAIADLNGDGMPDLLTVSSGTLGVLINNTNASRFSTASTVASSLNPSTYGQSVIFTATVTSTSGTPTGTVIFYNGTANIGSGTLANGKASIAVSSLPAGSHSITAAYQGSSTFAPSTSSPVAQTVARAATSTTLASSLNPAANGQSITFTATVTSQYGGFATGSVTFYNGSQSLGAGSLSNNRATLTTSFATAGAYTITAKYTGDTNNTGSASSALIQTIITSTTTTLSSSPNPSLAGQTVTFTATVSSSTGPPPNGESITFYNGSAILGVGSLAGGVANFATSSLAAGIYFVTATYPGDSTFAGSTSPALRQVVNSTTKSATSTTLTSSLNPSTYGQSVTFTAVVTTTGSLPPTGTVIFTWSGYNIGSATLNSSGVATLTKTNLNADTYPLTAIYKGDANNLGSTSAIVNQVVQQATSSAMLTSSPNPSNVGQAVTFTATITSLTAKPTGPVTFSAGKTILGTVNLSNEKATLTTSSLSSGSTVVTAAYNGDSNIGKSSASVTQTVH
ncbi:MAG TPA: Ig-like domain repeat protein [Candidatus Sulfotelmatobacter sp.]|jgi:hypothetical protein